MVDCGVTTKFSLEEANCWRVPHAHKMRRKRRAVAKGAQKSSAYVIFELFRHKDREEIFLSCNFF